MSEQYVIQNKKSFDYLNNIRCDFGRIVFVNFTHKTSPTVIRFSSKEDADNLCQRIAKHMKLTVEAVLHNA